MFRDFVICIFVLFTAIHGVTYSQELVYADRKAVTYYFEKKNQRNASLFELIENCPSDAFIKYHSTVTVEVFRQENNYLLKMKSYTNKVECLYRYQGFLIGDFIVADRITLRASMMKNDTSIIDIHLDNRDILDDSLIMDTILMSVLDFDNVHFLVSEIEYRVTQKGLQHLREGMKRIDNFFLFDTLAANWQRQLDLLDMSNIDMLPIYQFHLKDIEKEIKQYDSNEYEVLLSLSGMNNQVYLQKRASLFSRMENMTMELSQKLNIIDELMFKKAKQYEAEQNLQKAIFYYTRALDYNPLHCDALERLSDLYTRNNLHQENIDLFRGLRIRGEDVNCEASLTSSVCDSMCMKAAYLIEQRNYYDAIKFLDTMEQLFYQIPDTTYFQTYLRLRKQAQEGIYNSYFDVINRAIKVFKIDLCKEYIYGLAYVMKKDGNLPANNDRFLQMMDYFISRYKEHTKNKIKKKNYEEVILNNNAMIIFLDSIGYSYSEDLFLDAYITSCTALYYEKKKHSEENALAFLDMYRHYIVITVDEIPEGQDIIIQDNHNEKRYAILAAYVLNQAPSFDDYSLLDSIALLLQIESEQESINSVVDSLVIEQKINPLLQQALSKVNHYSWTNELVQANALMKRIDKVVLAMDFLKDTSALSIKYFQTTALLFDRINQRAGQDFNTLSKKVRQLTLQRQYWQAYQLLKDDNLPLRKTKYQQYIEELEKEIELPAVFQGKMFTVEQDFALEDYLSACAGYEQAYIYFVNHNIEQYGLVCDSLLAFVKKHEQEKFLQGACTYYMNKTDYSTALYLMMYVIDLGYKSKDLQIQLGTKMKQSSCDFALLSKEYVFTKVHDPFLVHYLGKFKTFWYHLKQWKLFGRKK
jgi:hypothetical protein